MWPHAVYLFPIRWLQSPIGGCLRCSDFTPPPVPRHAREACLAPLPSRPAHVRNIRMSASSLPYPEIPRSRDFPYRVQASFSRQVATFGLSTLVHSQRSRTQVSKTSLAVITLLYLSSRSAHGDVSRETSRAAYFDRYRPHLYLHQFDRHFILLCQ